MRITLESYGHTYTFESQTDDFTAEELKEQFSRLLVLAGYSPSVIELADGGRYNCEYEER